MHTHPALQLHSPCAEGAALVLHPAGEQAQRGMLQPLPVLLVLLTSWHGQLHHREEQLGLAG